LQHWVPMAIDMRHGDVIERTAGNV
jgi:hypothetical protein